MRRTSRFAAIGIALIACSQVPTGTPADGIVYTLRVAGGG